MCVTKISNMPVINAVKNFTLHITKEDVRGADTKKPNSCVVAKACKRSLHAKEVRVHLGRVYVNTNNKNWLRYLTPGSLRSEIIAFDRGGSFTLGKHTLGAIGPRKSSGKRQGTNKDVPRDKHKKRQGVRHVVKNVRTGPAC